MPPSNPDAILQSALQVISKKPEVPCPNILECLLHSIDTPESIRHASSNERAVEVRVKQCDSPAFLILEMAQPLRVARLRVGELNAAPELPCILKVAVHQDELAPVVVAAIVGAEAIRPKSAFCPSLKSLL
ncbi:hypothetical protein DL765_004760 [Monosporascus sp. GIB2]|nr:hypothetical protein DL765_004760 [Monosporascus sp. GIB2]